MQKFKLVTFLVTFLLSTTTCYQQKFLVPSEVNNRKDLINSALVRANLIRVLIPFVCTTTRSQPAQGAQQLSNEEFYQRWPYQTPSDILDYIAANSKAGEVDEVIKAMDNFASYYPMYKLSPIKASLLKETVRASNPKHILEIGTFFGYSALNIIRSMPSDCTLVCIEGSEENARIARSIVHRAFLNRDNILKRVRILTGISSALLQQPQQLLSPPSENNETFDFVFLDHDKDCYLPDLNTLESKNLLNKSQCVIVADNVIFPGAPDFLEAVGYKREGNGQENKQRKWTTRLVELPFERIGYETKFEQIKDAMSISRRVLLHEKKG